MKIELKGLPSAAVIAAFLFFSLHSAADTYTYRNHEVFDINSNQISYVTLYTYPVQAHTVYAWRTHEESPDVEGDYGYDLGGEIVGYTGANGTWSHSIVMRDVSQRFCGKYVDEQYAVGSPLASRTPKNTFYIVDSTQLHFGPYITDCDPDVWGVADSLKACR